MIKKRFIYSGVDNPDEQPTGWHVGYVLCVIGVFCYLFLSPPLLARFGFNYETDTGNAFAKIYPGVYFFVLAFLITIASEGSPLKKLGSIAARFPAFSFLLFFYITAIIYLVMRSGFSGISAIVNSHLPVPICAIIFSMATRKQATTMIKLMIYISVLNSFIGIMESAFRFRIFPYAENWVVLVEKQFRATALMGHPLSNALFTCMIIPITMGHNFNPRFKMFALLLYMLSLVAFGGRASLGIAVMSLIPIGYVALRNTARTITLRKLIFAFIGALLIPAALIFSVYTALTSSMGDRLVEHGSLNDESAQNRLYSFKVLELMEPSQLLFGMSNKEGGDVIRKLGYGYPVSDIENPWLIMLMLFGVILFVIWLIATFAMIRSLTRNTPFEIKLSVLCYFLSASFANSFGRQENVYTLMAVAAVCSKLVLNKTQASEDLTTGTKK